MAFHGSHGRNLLAPQNQSKDSETNNENTRDQPSRSDVVQPPRNLLDAYPTGFTATLLRIAPLLTLLRTGIRVRRRRRPRNVHGHNGSRRNILAAVDVHPLLLSTRGQAISANLHAGRRSNQQPPAGINGWDLYCRRVPGVRQLVGEPH